MWLPSSVLAPVTNPATVPHVSLVEPHQEYLLTLRVSQSCTPDRRDTPRRLGNDSQWQAIGGEAIAGHGNGGHGNEMRAGG